MLFILLKVREWKLILVLCRCCTWESFQALQDIQHGWTGLWFLLGAVLYQICQSLRRLLRHSAQKGTRGMQNCCCANDDCQGEASIKGGTLTQATVIVLTSEA